MNIQTYHFTNTLKGWRKVRKMSQLDLALAAEVSQRHVSWLETGRSKPS
ncbi:MAG: transcriptional regulator with XRE-family HTH domain [Cryomorphaceae bacterium]|jgi:transcriptional regulator with XRE-family HTH domain